MRTRRRSHRAPVVIRRATWVLAAVVTLGVAFLALPVTLDAWFHRVTDVGSRSVSAAAQALHGRLTIVDLHADSLLWPRDPLRRHGWGHVDLPRLLDGNVALQVLSTVNQVPLGAGNQGNRPAPDVIAPLAIAQRWPAATWFSPFERVRFQAARLHDAIRRSRGQLLAIRDRNDLDRLERLRTEARASGRPVPVGALLAVEGADFLVDDPGRLEWLHQAGFRIVGLLHLLDTRLGGSAQGEQRGSLTEAGSQVLEGMRRLGMLPDLAHSSVAVIREVLARFPGPVLISHTGLAGTCPGARNLDDDTVREVARAGGLIGIGFWPAAVCGSTVDAVVSAIRHGIDVAGIDHIALGSDFDGSVTVPFAADGLVRLTEALMAAGLSEDAISQVMGGNALRWLRLVLGG